MLSLGVLLIIYIAVCCGKIASKYGKNPILYGVLSVISPINLIILGYLAFSDWQPYREKSLIRLQ